MMWVVWGHETTPTMARASMNYAYSALLSMFRNKRTTPLYKRKYHGILNPVFACDEILVVVYT